MSDNSDQTLAVPTNIISGFLGVGKTTAILHLLAHKPSNESWAVLVNEFGEIGIDGSLLSGQYSEEKGVFIREVPGGCMCCTAGLPMQIALNQLLSRAKPDRLLIEPTGLGHPLEVLQVLLSEHYQDVLAVQKIVTLVDARKLTDQRYIEHETFNQQIAIADIIVGNKEDLYEGEDKKRLRTYAKQKGSPYLKVIFTQQGVLEPDCLQGATATTLRVRRHDHHQNDTSSLSEAPIPACGYIKAVNQGEGFESIGWRFDPSKQFKRADLFTFISGLVVERMKAVFITESGIFGYNLTSDTLTEIELDDCMESRIEIITTKISDDWEPQLLACIDVND